MDRPFPTPRCTALIWSPRGYALNRCHRIVRVNGLCWVHLWYVDAPDPTLTELIAWLREKEAAATPGRHAVLKDGLGYHVATEEVVVCDLQSGDIDEDRRDARFLALSRNLILPLLEVVEAVQRAERMIRYAPEPTGVSVEAIGIRDGMYEARSCLRDALTTLTEAIRKEQGR